jgi:hypothetical protein
MSDDDFELVRGSGNVFRDFGDANPDLVQARAILAAEIIKVLDGRKLTMRCGCDWRCGVRILTHP